VYFAERFVGGGGNRWAVRTAGAPSQIAGAVRAAAAGVDSQFLVTELQPMEALVSKAQGETRFSLVLIGVFAVMAVLLVGVGLYGVLSTLVRQRTAEIGVRVALGASPRRIRGFVVGHGLRLTALGIVVGLIAALALTRGMTSMLVGVRPTDPVTFAAVGAVFLVIAVVSLWVPARRAAALDPTVALREG